MRRYVKPALRYSADATSKIASQVFVTVITALLVALITNSVMHARNDGTAFAPAGMAAFGDASGARPGPTLPPLEAVVIEDMPLPPEPAVVAPEAPGGLYYADTGERLDPLAIMERAGT